MGRKSFEFWTLGYAREVSDIAYRIYDYLCYRANKRGECWASCETIARETGTNLQSVTKAIQELVIWNLMEIAERQRNPVTKEFTRTVYRIREIEKPCPDEIPRTIRELRRKRSPKKEPTHGGTVDGSERDEKGRFTRKKGGATHGGTVKATHGGTVKATHGGTVWEPNITSTLKKEEPNNTSASNRKKDSKLSPLDGVKKSQRPKRKFQDRRSKPSLLGRSRAGESKLGTKPHKGMPSLGVESLRELLKSREPRWLRAHLVSRGYDPQEADKAIREAQAPEAGRPRRR